MSEPQPKEDAAIARAKGQKPARRNGMGRI
jgi:hypothetical protein